VKAIKSEYYPIVVTSISSSSTRYKTLLLSASTQSAGELPVGRWIHTFSRCPVWVPACSARAAKPRWI